MTTSIIRNALVGVAIAGALMGSVTVMAQPSNEADDARYLAIQRQRYSEIIAIPGVHGMGVGPSRTDESRLVIFVYVQPGTSAEARQRIPPTLDGAPVEVIEKAPATLQ